MKDGREARSDGGVRFAERADGLLRSEDGGGSATMTATLLADSIRAALRVVAPGPSLLALDYDGTLASFRVDRAEARMPRELLRLLAALVACEQTRIVIVSGRPIAELEALIELEPGPELVGVHGWERRLPDGTRADHELPSAVRALFEDEWRGLREQLSAERLERKSASLALHLRGVEASEAEALRADVEGRWSALAEGQGLELRRFDGGLELRHPGRGKGDVMRELLAELPAGALAAYLGDDETDEDAFRALEGRGLAVLVADRPRKTAARHLIPHSGVATLLREWLERAGCTP